jgi:hypothetical protein
METIDFGVTVGLLVENDVGGGSSLFIDGLEYTFSTRINRRQVFEDLVDKKPVVISYGDRLGANNLCRFDLYHGHELTGSHEAKAVAFKCFQRATQGLPAVVFSGVNESGEEFKEILFGGKITRVPAAHRDSYFEVKVIAGKVLTLTETTSTPDEKPLTMFDVVITHGERTWRYRDARIVTYVPYTSCSDKLVCRIRDRFGERVVIDGKLSEPFSRIEGIVNVGGEPAFKALRDEKTVIVHGAKIFNVSSEAHPLRNPTGELAWIDRTPEGGYGLFINGHRTLDLASGGRSFAGIGFDVEYHAPVGGCETVSIVIRGGLSVSDKDLAFLIALPQGEAAQTTCEKELLRKMTLVAAPTAQDVREYREERRAEEAEQRQKTAGERGASAADFNLRGVVNGFNRMIQERPELFLDLFRAKTTPPLKAHITEVLRSVAPVSVAASERDEQHRSTSELTAPLLPLIRSIFGAGDNTPSVTSLFERVTKATVGLVGADPKHSSARELITSSRSTPHFLTKYMLASYGKDGWQRLSLPPGATHSLETQMVSCVAYVKPKESTLGAVLTRVTALFSGGRRNEEPEDAVALPRMLNSKYITSRVHSCDAHGRETPIDAEMGPDGTARTLISDGVQRVVYSIAVPTEQAMRAAVTSVSQSDYRRFITNTCSAVSNQILAPLGELSETARDFLTQIKDEPPMVRIERIRGFISERGHYDWDNREVRHAHEKRDPTTNFAMMELRALTLKQAGRAEDTKEFAGVCLDYAMLCAAMLRESGIPAGILNGIAIDEKGSGKESAGHAKVFVPWPVAERPDEYIFLEIEATPSNDAPRNQSSTPSDTVSANDKAASVGNETAAAVHSSALEKDQLATTLSADKIKGMVNGNLEIALNQLLTRITPDNVANVAELIELALYGPEKPSSEGFSTYAEGLRRQRDTQPHTSKTPHRDFFASLSFYVDCASRRLNKQDNQSPSEIRRAAILQLENIVERGQAALSKEEFLTTIAALAYLRSEKMLRQ